MRKILLTIVCFFLFFIYAPSDAHAGLWATGLPTNGGKTWTMSVCTTDAGSAGTYPVQYASFWCSQATGDWCPYTPLNDLISQLYQLNVSLIVPFDSNPNPPIGSNCSQPHTFSVTPLEPPYPCGRIQSDVIISNDGGATYTNNLGGGIYTVSGVNCPAPTPTSGPTPTPGGPTPTPTPNAPTMSLIINAGGNAAVAQGTYGNTGLRADEPNNPPGAGHGSNYYNSINVNPKFSGKSQTDTGLVGFAFTSKTGATSGTGIGNLKSLTSSVNGFLVVYTYCSNLSSCQNASDGKSFTADKMYIYYNGNWLPQEYDPGQEANIGNNTFLVTIQSASFNSPIFRVQILKNAGSQQWATYTFFKQNDGSGASGEFFARKPACNSSGTCTSSFLPLELQKQLYALNTIN